MELTKGFVFLADVPLLSIKLNMNNILCILAVVSLVHVDSSLLNTYLERHAENVRSLLSQFTVANLHMISKATDFVLHKATFALNRLSILK